MFDTDYIDAFVNGYVVQQRLQDHLAQAEQVRMIKAYRAAHPETRLRSRTAQLLRRTADRLAPEPAPRPRLQMVGGTRG